MPSAGLDVFGDLKMVQKQPLAHKGLDERFSASIFNKTTIFPEAFNFKKIIRQYNEQNGKYAVWKTLITLASSDGLSNTIGP